MTTAENILNAIKSSNPVAVTLECGYLVARNGSRIRFEAGTVISESRTKQGRVSKMEARYKDGSGLIYRWSEKFGPGYTLTAPAAVPA